MKKKIIALIAGTGLIAAIAAGCGSSSSSDTSAQTADSTTQTATADSTTSDTSGGTASQTTDSTSQTTGSTSQTTVTDETAKTIALEQAGITEADTIALTVKTDYDDGVSVYEVDIYTADMDYDYEISTTDGTVLHASSEACDKLENISITAAVTPEQAQEIILAKVSGATADNLRIKAEYDDGQYIYEGEVIYNNMSYEFELDAQTGNILEWSQETL